jgi:hypothetical protein
MEPMEPVILLLGSTGAARNPSLTNDSDFKPLDVKFGSEGEMTSSKYLTR